MEPGIKRSVMGEIIGEKRLGCQNSAGVARLISERMWTFNREAGPSSQR